VKILPGYESSSYKSINSLLKLRRITTVDWLFSAFLGMVQGLTEFLPISSSGHLAIFQGFFGMQNIEQTNAAFDVLLHFGTLLAIFVVYWRDIVILVIEFFSMIGDLIKGKGLKLSNMHRRMVAAIIVSIIPLFFVMLVYRGFHVLV
jgi:undecaprenyl-diphosphatase